MHTTGTREAKHLAEHKKLVWLDNRLAENTSGDGVAAERMVGQKAWEGLITTGSSQERRPSNTDRARTRGCVETYARCEPLCGCVLFDVGRYTACGETVSTILLSVRTGRKRPSTLGILRAESGNY